MISHVAGLLVLTSIMCFAQITAPSSVDVSQEPKHHLAFENTFVRAFEVEVPVGTETLIHRHSHPYVYVSIGDADVRNDVVDKDPVTIHPRDGEVKFVRGGFAHKAVNVGKTDFRNVTVELLKTGQGMGVTFGGGRGMTNAQANEGWMAVSYELAHGASTTVANEMRDYALIAVSDLDLTTSAERPSNPPIRMRAGEVKWLAGGVSQEWRNNAATPARYVVLRMLPVTH